MTSDHHWQKALAEHQVAVEAYIALVSRLPESRWQEELRPGKWSPATLTLHVTDAYAMGARAVAGGSSMRLRIPRWQAWIYRTLLLPRLLKRGQFPIVRAPREIQPDLEIARSLTREAAFESLRARAMQAGAALRAAGDHPDTPRLTHAFFGELHPHLALRFLTAHTQHHTKELARLA